MKKLMFRLASWAERVMLFAAVVFLVLDIIVRLAGTAVVTQGQALATEEAHRRQHSGESAMMDKRLSAIENLLSALVSRECKLLECKQ